MFILRTLFWLAVLILVLPTGKSADTDTVTPAAAQANFDAGSALDAAIATVGDVSSFCTRNPKVCETGSAAAAAFESKAKQGVRMLYDWATGNEGDGNAEVGQPTKALDRSAARFSGQADAVVTGSFQMASGDKPKSQNTLRLDDIIPEWSGPRKKQSA